jgi:hypothetical protein
MFLRVLEDDDGRKDMLELRLSLTGDNRETIVVPPDKVRIFYC